MDRQNLLGLLKDWGVAALITLGVLLALRVAGFTFASSPATQGPAPALTAPLVDGTAFNLADRRAQAYVVNFWATWCAPCRQEIPEFSAFAAAHPEVEVLGVSVDGAMSSPQLEAAALQLGIRYPVLHDRDQVAARAWGVSSFPTTFILDADREIVAVHVGTMDRRRLEEAVDRAR